MDLHQLPKHLLAGSFRLAVVELWRHKQKIFR